MWRRLHCASGTDCHLRIPFPAIAPNFRRELPSRSSAECLREIAATFTMFTTFTTVTEAELLLAREQPLAILDTATGEVVRITLRHERNNVRGRVESGGLWGILLVLSMYSIQSMEFQRFKSLRIDFDVIAEMLGANGGHHGAYRDLSGNRVHRDLGRSQVPNVDSSSHQGSSQREFTCSNCRAIHFTLEGTEGVFWSATQSSTRSLSISIGKAPPFSTSSWKARISNLSPS